MSQYMVSLKANDNNTQQRKRKASPTPPPTTTTQQPKRRQQDMREHLLTPGAFMMLQPPPPPPPPPPPTLPYAALPLPFPLIDCDNLDLEHTVTDYSQWREQEEQVKNYLRNKRKQKKEKERLRQIQRWEEERNPPPPPPPRPPIESIRYVPRPPPPTPGQIWIPHPTQVTPPWLATVTRPVRIANNPNRPRIDEWRLDSTGIPRFQYWSYVGWQDASQIPLEMYREWDRLRTLKLANNS